MVKKVSKFFAYTLFFVFALILFISKASVYYVAEKNLQKFDVIVSNETLEESLFALGIQNLDVSVKGIESASIEKADIILFGIYNRITFENIELSSVVNSLLPPKIENATLNYNVLNPFVVKAEAVGEFGEVQVVFEFFERKLVATLKPSQKMIQGYKNSLREFKKDETGDYIYAKNF